MSLAFVLASAAQAGTGVASLTYAFDATGVDGLFVGGGNQSPQLWSSCTFNGTALDAGELWDAIDDIGLHRSCGYLGVIPLADRGSHNVVITAAAACDLIFSGAVGFSGMHQTAASAHGTAVTANETAGAGPTVTVVDFASDDILIDCAVTYGTTIAVGADQTARVEDDSIVGGSASAGISTQAGSVAGGVMSWTGGAFWVTGAVAIKPAGAAATCAPTLTLLGVGRCWLPLAGLEWLRKRKNLLGAGPCLKN